MLTHRFVPSSLYPPHSRYRHSHELLSGFAPAFFCMQRIVTYQLLIDLSRTHVHSINLLRLRIRDVVCRLLMKFFRSVTK